MFIYYHLFSYFMIILIILIPNTHAHTHERLKTQLGWGSTSFDMKDTPWVLVKVSYSSGSLWSTS